MIALWAAAVYISRERPGPACLMAALPALFMSGVSNTYILMADEGFRISQAWAYPLGAVFTGACGVLFLLHVLRYKEMK